MTLYVLLSIITEFKVVIFVVLFFYGYKLVMRFIAPKVVEKAADKIYRDLKNQESSQGRHSVKKGDMTIDFSDKKPKQYRRADGDYIEFEEIDDKK
jgi:flagellar biosynthesis/type III secretory pathway M-ring protein FliF/YscJ